jgi:hypothetical protein
MKKRMKQAETTAPKKGAGKKITAGHGMGGLFGAGPKKLEPDNPPPTRSKEHGARMKRISNKFI